ncbi:hypothetical protein LX87_02810 [Larkinella arboricola]|uniref:ABC transporter ATPase n=1 Tax=Larkinella arboricola TaxID=643671 RepID=A0A327X0U6_LARAB|nr:hypothetical protein [Larkinella arboricola]RAJ97904.1 hypothetical protein LX87_02810 [Larkinella arboricola]
MWTSFNQLPDTARVWIYQSARPLTDAEVSAIENELQPAVDNWAAHGTPLLGSAQLLHNRFLIVGVDEGHHLPSGCSIDASVRWVREIGLALKTDFFDRSAAFVTAEGAIETVALPQIKAAVTEGRITPETTVFNNLVATKAELAGNWRIKAEDSWLKRYFKTTAA